MATGGSRPWRFALGTTLLVAMWLLPAGSTIAEEEERGMRIIDLAVDPTPWRTIDDVVMGGVSSSRIVVGDGVAVFSGRVSLDNNGGFASARSADGDHDLSAFSGVRLKVRGDGKRYALRLRTRDARDGVSYLMRFETEAGEWQEIVLPFADFVPSFRGRVVEGHPPVDPARVCGFGLLIADRQAGPFRLELAWIEGAKGGF
jgi:monofunctional biosynthetic peptidoglycan transglycosylase